MNPEERLGAGFAVERLIPFWAQVGDLMFVRPRSGGRRLGREWKAFHPPGGRAGELGSVGGGGERRAGASADLGLGGLPYTILIFWAGVRCQARARSRPSSARPRNAFRLVGGRIGVGTVVVVDGGSVVVRRGGFLVRARPAVPAPPQHHGLPHGGGRWARYPICAPRVVLCARIGAGERRLDVGCVAVRAVACMSGAAGGVGALGGSAAPGRFKARCRSGAAGGVGARGVSRLADRRLSLGARLPGSGRGAAGCGRVGDVVARFGESAVGGVGCRRLGPSSAGCGTG